jgi:fused signal recognition particle receptor
MEELKKVKRTIEHLTTDLSVILVVDSVMGHSAINQVKEFNNALGLTGVIMTKYDAARSALPIDMALNFGIPVFFVGTGETIDDLEEFSLTGYLDTLFVD